MRSWIRSASFRPPTLPDLRCSHPPAWVLLDTEAYIADSCNSTTAEASTRAGQVVKVSFCLTDPPGVSHLCVHCPGLSESVLAVEPRVICSENELVVLSISFNFGHTTTLDEYFIYKAHPNRPSLHLLPSPYPRHFRSEEVGLLPFVPGNTEGFILVSLRPRLIPRQYDLHIFSSVTWVWSTKLVPLVSPLASVQNNLLPHRADKVIVLEGGCLGWVNLWQGILLCNVLDEHPAVRLVRLPKPMGNNNMHLELERDARWCRDVTSKNNLIKLIEIETYETLVGLESSCDPDKHILFDEDLKLGNNGYTVNNHTIRGWRAATWHMMDSWKYWHEDCTMNADDIRINNPRHSEMLPELKNMVMCAPTLSMHGNDVVYLMSKVNQKDVKAWVIALNMRNKTCEELVSISVERAVYFNPTYCPSAFSKYLVTAQAAREGNDSKNGLNNKTILVSGLHPHVTEDQLRQVFTLFGELHYVKIFAQGRYGFVQFICRSCAEKAIGALDGTQIGGKDVHLSWSCSTENKQG